MADVKISALPASTTPLAGTEVLPIVQSSTTKQVSVANLTAGRAVSASSLTLTTALTVENGGTGLTSLTAGYIPYGNGTGAFSSGALIVDSGNLGLGATPSAWYTTYTSRGLQVGSLSSLSYNGYLGSTNVGFNVYQSAASTFNYISAGIVASQYVQDGGAHKWFTTGTTTGSAGSAISFTQAMTLDASGNLLVGTTSNYGGGIFDANYSGITNAFSVRASGASFAGACFMMYADRNTTNGSFKALSYYNVGASTYRFYVFDSGNVQNTNNSYGAISDVKLKDNIVDTAPKLDDLLKVRVRNYNLKSDPDLKQIGMVSQELEEVFPGLVEDLPDMDAKGNPIGTTTKHVKYSVFTPIMIKAIQELAAKVSALEAKQ